MKTKKQIALMAKDHPAVTRGIYFLLWNDDIVYVGQSNWSCESRILDHTNDEDKYFNRTAIVPMNEASDEEITMAEAEYILAIKPACNRSVPGTGRYYGMKRIMEVFSSRGIKLNKETLLSCKGTRFCGTTWFNVDEVWAAVLKEKNGGNGEGK